ECLLDANGKGEQIIVIDFHNEWDCMSRLARDGAEKTQRGSNGVAAAFDGELDDVAAVEITGILGEACAAGMLDALVHGKNGKIARAAEPAVAEHALEICKHAEVAIGRSVDAIDKIRTGKMQALLRDF